MGLLTIIRKNKRKEREMRILFLGLDNAGKTTILKRLKGQDVMSTSPTLGFEISTLTHGKYLLNIWDVGGQRTLRPYWRNYFEQTDVLVWVVDSGDRLRMNDCREELHALLQEQRLAGASLLVFANKQDITGSMTDAEIKRALDLPSIRSHRWRIQACSAFTGENVHSGLEWAVSEVAQRVYWGVVDVDTSAGVNTSVIPENQPSSAVGDHNGVFVVRGSGVIRAALKFGTRVFLTQCHSMTAVDVSIYPNATGNALDTVRNHSAGDVDTSELVFYSGWFCPFVQRAWIALEEKGIPYLYQEENPYKKDAKFIEKFPKGLVPGALYKGKPIAESLVILEFLEDAYPQVPLLPSDPYARAQVRYAVDNVTKSILPPFYRLLQAQEVEKQDEARQDLYEGLRTFAKGTSGPFWAGEQFTHADITLLPFIVRLPILETHRGFKKAEVGHDFEAYTERVVALPSVQRTLSEPDRYEEVYGRYLRNESQSEVAKNTRARRILP